MSEQPVAEARPSSDDSPVTVSIDGQVGSLTLSAGRRRNPLSSAVMREITEILRRLDDTADVHVVIIRAQGPAFSAGHDLRELVDRTLEDEREVFAACTEMMETIHAIRQPVIAEVAGFAFAAGCQLVASCDLAVAATTATFSTPGVRIGLFCSTPMVALTRAVGRKRAMKMLLTGDVIDADTAADWGLVNDVVGEDELASAVRDLALRIATASSTTIAIGKQAFYQQIDRTEHDAYRLMQETMATNAMTCDAQEGISAFLEKRPPVWS